MFPLKGEDFDPNKLDPESFDNTVPLYLDVLEEDTFEAHTSDEEKGDDEKVVAEGEVDIGEEKIAVEGDPLTLAQGTDVGITLGQELQRNLGVLPVTPKDMDSGVNQKQWPKPIFNTFPTTQVIEEVPLAVEIDKDAPLGSQANQLVPLDNSAKEGLTTWHYLSSLVAANV